MDVIFSKQLSKMNTERRNVKKFFYLDNYEINYSNGKNRIMVKNYQTKQIYEFLLSEFILRYHSHLQQDKSYEINVSNKLLEALTYAIQKRKLKCDFFVDDDKLWLNMNNQFNEYYYDITTHFLVMCYNNGNYEWFSLLDNKIVEYHNAKFALNKISFELLQSWVYISIKQIFGITSHDTKD